MKTMGLRCLALSIMLATGTLVNAEVINGFTNGNASENPQSDSDTFFSPVQRWRVFN